MLCSQVIVGQAMVQRCSATVNFIEKERPFFPVTVNNKYLHEHFKKVAGDILGENNIKEMQPLMGSEDFSFFAEQIPAYYCFIGMRNESLHPFQPSHSPSFTINEDVLPIGAVLQASLATRYLLELHPNSPSSTGTVHDEL